MELQAKSAAGRPAKRYKIVAVNENRDFKRAYAKGKSSVSPMLVTYHSKNRGKHLRVGITASKKIGNAVQSDLICTGNQQPVAQRVRAHGIFGLCHCSSLTYVSLIIA